MPRTVRGLSRTRSGTTRSNHSRISWITASLCRPLDARAWMLEGQRPWGPVALPTARLSSVKPRVSGVPAARSARLDVEADGDHVAVLDRVVLSLQSQRSSLPGP